MNNSISYLPAGKLYQPLLLILLLFLLATHPATAAQSNTVHTPHLRASLLSEQHSIEPGQTFWVALHFDIIAGWHTYWQNAGDSGEAPRIEWTLPAGFTASDIHWPYPARLPVGPLMNYGYSQQAWMLVRLSVPEKLEQDQISLTAQARWLVCKEECIPEQGQFQLSLPVVARGSSQPSSWHADFQHVLQRLPQPAPWPASIQLRPETLELQLQLGAAAAAQLKQAYFFPAEYGVLEHAAPQTYHVTADSLNLQLRRGDLKGQPLTQLNGVLVISEQLPDGILTQAFTINAPAASPAAAPGIGLILSFALLGGLLLNIMPCVFPILSFKALNIVQAAAQSPVLVRRNGYVFTLGVLLSFAIIAGILLALRAGGEAIGWGFQLQSPGFVLVLTWLIFAMGLLFSGVWSFGESWMGLGQSLTTGRAYRGSFFTGVLAVVVATPCTAPFMGTALGYALSQPAWLAMLVFVLLGFGMALPWLAISLWPGLSGFLPKPGAWMERVKQVLAFPLYATVAWLLWVLAQQVDQPSLLYALVSLVLLALGLWFWHIARPLRAAWRNTARLSLLLILLALGSLLVRLEPIQSVTTPDIQTWQAYDPARLTALREQGNPVLVNFTAAWCITCLVNEKVVLGTPELQTELRNHGVVYMKGDWTNRDPRISRVLEQYGRSGVPLYLLYPADLQREAIVLPNILTHGIVVAALRQLD